MDYYNENNLKIAKWLKNLITAGMLPPGDVDTRSIEEVTPSDLATYTRCHFFAGIGGWPLALQLANWPTNRPVWTGSCPCQPFSLAGSQKGYNDERHLWPIWADLIAACEPPTIFGEQVASPAGREWLGDVRNSLEALGYSVGAADLCAASVGAPHIRQRLYWVGYAQREGLERHCGDERSSGGPQASRSTTETDESRGLADPDSERRERERLQLLKWREVLQAPWADKEYIECAFDGKYRPAKPGIQLLVNGVSSRVAKLHGLGNAIVPQLAAAFILASS